jgi:predicted nucleotidyltransferase
MTLLGDRLLAVHTALQEAGIPHAIGGAIAYAYCSEEPRGTRDVDVNVFVEPDRADEVFAALPKVVRVTEANREVVARDGQVRLWWDETPVDLFFETHDFHREVAREIREVPFEGATIPVIGCEALIVFKAMFNRSRDWGDIEAMLDARSVDCRRVVERLRSLMGTADPVVVRLSTLCND